MSSVTTRVKPGTRFLDQGTLLEVLELIPGPKGIELILQEQPTRRLRRATLAALLANEHTKIVTTAKNEEPPPHASLSITNASDKERAEVSERADHVREVLTGYKSGNKATALPHEPLPKYDPDLSLKQRYANKSRELNVSTRTLYRWAGDYTQGGEAALLRQTAPRIESYDEWAELALTVMAEKNTKSRPSRASVVTQTNDLASRAPQPVKIPSRSSAYRILTDLERQQPTFRLSTNRNRDIATRPDSAYGRLRPTRPGEYVLMDTNRLDVFALDPVTLRWVQAELTVAMDWYTRCIVGMRITPASTKSIDAASVLYECFRPRPAPDHWPPEAAWPNHGIPKNLVVDKNAMAATATPAISPETIIIDHGKVFVSQHLTSACQRTGISIQPARIRTGRDKGPIERFFRTLREDLLQLLPGYKGPDVHSRGESPEDDACYFLNELEAIIREWVALIYHRRPHTSLIDPNIPGLHLTPSQMFEHGVARAGYIDVPNDPDLAYQFLDTKWRTIQHYGIEINKRRYDGSALNAYRNTKSPYHGENAGKWPFQADPDDITKVYFQDPATSHWHTLTWEHAPAMNMPMSEDALNFARKLAAKKYTYPDDKLAVLDLTRRWETGLAATSAERRIALRLTTTRTELPIETPPVLETLPSLRQAQKRMSPPTTPAPEADTHDATLAATVEAPLHDEGDDDAVDEPFDMDYYDDAMEDA